MGFTTTASAWHFEVEYDGGGWFESGPESFHLDDGMMFMPNAYWRATPHEEGDPDPDNPDYCKIWVDYEISSGWSDYYDSRGQVEFQIVSDFGNPYSQPVDVWFTAEAYTYEWVEQTGNLMGLDGYAMAEVHVDSNFGFMLDSWSNEIVNVDEPIELESNMWYSIDTNIWMDAWVSADQPGPDWFESWDDYYAYFMDGEEGEIMAECDGYFVFDAWIQTAEVPVPGTIWLLGSGLMGMVMMLRRKS